jgi:hypothetical protein
MAKRRRRGLRAQRGGRWTTEGVEGASFWVTDTVWWSRSSTNYGGGEAENHTKSQDSKKGRAKQRYSVRLGSLLTMKPLHRTHPSSVPTSIVVANSASFVADNVFEGSTSSRLLSLVDVNFSIASPTCKPGSDLGANMQEWTPLTALTYHYILLASAE